MTMDGIRRADYIVWVGNEALCVRNVKEGESTNIPLRPREEIPYVPRFYTVWEEGEGGRNGASCREMFIRALGGRLRARMSRVVLAVPDDIVWVEKRALEDFALMAGTGGVGRRLFFCPQGEVLRGSGERYIGVTWSSRCWSVSRVREGSAERKLHLDIARSGPEELASAVRTLDAGERLPVYYPGIEDAPLPVDFGSAVSLEQIF